MKLIRIGKIVNTHGIKGELRFDCWCDSPEFLIKVKKFYLDDKGEKFLEIASYRPSIPSVIFKGYEDRNSASVLTGKTVFHSVFQTLFITLYHTFSRFSSQTILWLHKIHFHFYIFCKNKKRQKDKD